MDTQHETTEEPSDVPAQRDNPPQPPRPLLPTSRIVLLVLLAIMAACWVVDRKARWSAEAAFNTLQNALGDEQSQATVSRDEVHQLAGKAPDDDGDPDDLFEQYSWQGVPLKHTVYVVYWAGKVTKLKDVSLNQPPR
jgi:hypothetical protein